MIHRDLGPGLLEDAYEIVLAGELSRRGLRIDRQKPVDIEFNGVLHSADFRIDILVENALIVEIKSIETLNNAHLLTDQPVGLLLNFAGATMKDGIRRVGNEYRQPQAPSASPRLRVKSHDGDG